MAGRRGHKGGKKKGTSLLHTGPLAHWSSGPAGWVQSHRLCPSQSATAPPKSTGPALLTVLSRTEVREPPWPPAPGPRSEASGVRPRPESMHDRQRTLSLAATWNPGSMIMDKTERNQIIHSNLSLVSRLMPCNVENNLLRKRTTSRNMTVTIYHVPS
ncbi:hypothetical protein NDU88_000225 [Pleurodeles waltl]|uniref:Uncharacterized protein n=1 Tax=Pleurodeles waltl TaxID=8319 RepID=A0AAV7TED3_PLEWA|nr:hypothetical protein NDU88_000225 [Pleurodeles waltl]